MIKADEFVRMFTPNKDYKQREKSTKSNNHIQFGKVDPGYSSGRPSVIYDIDVQSSTLSKPLPYLSSYTPQANDRVMIVKGVIIGKII
jgi:hypothetical protein